jgi:Chalcone isomerase-like
MLRNILFAFVMLIGVSHNAYAVQNFPALEKAIPNMAKVGQGRLTTLLFDVYDIALYAPQGAWREDRAAALSIEYKLSIDGVDLAERSADEMRRQNISAAKIAGWEKELKAIFPDVQKGTTISALYSPKKETRFYRDGKEIGIVRDAEFGPAFFAIWLGTHTSEPDLRAELLGAP